MPTIQERVLKIVSDHLGSRLEDTKPESNLVSDLGADSLDTVELIMAVEDDFRVEIPDEHAEKLLTAADIVAWLDKHQRFATTASS